MQRLQVANRTIECPGREKERNDQPSASVRVESRNKNEMHIKYGFLQEFTMSVRCATRLMTILLKGRQKKAPRRHDLTSANEDRATFHWLLVVAPTNAHCPSKKIRNCVEWSFLFSH